MPRVLELVVTGAAHYYDPVTTSLYLLIPCFPFSRKHPVLSRERVTPRSISRPSHHNRLPLIAIRTPGHLVAIRLIRDLHRC